MATAHGVATIGSASNDDIYFVPRFPKDHETLHATKFVQAFGGKGSNQAVMSAILGKAEKSNHTNIFICCLGNDSNGHKMLQNFKYHHFSNVDKHVRIMDNVSSGLANVMVETTTGNNRIIIVAGANALLSPEHIDQSWDDVVLHCNVIVCQLETSVSVALHAFRKATEKSSRKIITILNTAPAQKNLPDELLQLTHVCIANEEEAEMLTNVHVANPEDAKLAAKQLSEKGCKQVIITLGAQGSLIYDSLTGKAEHVPAIKVDNVVDTTGAGDAFTGCVAHFLSLGSSLGRAVKYATYVCSLSIQKPGAQSSYPDGSCLQEVHYDD